ncbi:MAG: hypothetical protein J3Q66DRAFT_362974 [Benniella sp.]|nr:MAG: hypothetical protein J3Q66DRAFT_362974 [Benniella sp.]
MFYRGENIRADCLAHTRGDLGKEEVVGYIKDEAQDEAVVYQSGGIKLPDQASYVTNSVELLLLERVSETLFGGACNTFFYCFELQQVVASGNTVELLVVPTDSLSLWVLLTAAGHPQVMLVCFPTADSLSSYA